MCTTETQSQSDTDAETATETDTETEAGTQPEESVLSATEQVVSE